MLLQDGELLVVDPDNREEAAAAGLMTVVVNTHSDICTVRKVSGVGISMAQVHNLSPPDTVTTKQYDAYSAACGSTSCPLGRAWDNGFALGGRPCQAE